MGAYLEHAGSPASDGDSDPKCWPLGLPNFDHKRFMTTLSQLTYGWSGATILGTAGIAGMIVGGLICWACDWLSQRMSQIRQQRRTLASIRPRRTAELEISHSRGIAR